MIKIAVCDDDSKCKETTKQLLQEYFSKQSEIPAKINGFSSGEELLEDVGFNGKYDVYVIDILMDTLNGIETARKLREKNDSGIIIFLTTSKEYAVDSYTVDAFYYLIKPVEREQLYMVLERVKEKLSRRRSKSISVKTKNDLQLLKFDDICYVELIKKCLYFHTVNRDVIISTTQRISFMEAVAPLFADERFMPCGASFAINLFCVKTIEKNEVVFSNGEILQIPKNAAGTLRNKWFDYWFEGDS